MKRLEAVAIQKRLTTTKLEVMKLNSEPGVTDRMNNILNKVNIVIRHLDKNTSRDSGKVRIGFNKNHMYNSSVEQSKLIKQLDMKCYTDNKYKQIQEIKKKKKGNTTPQAKDAAAPSFIMN